MKSYQLLQLFILLLAFNVSFGQKKIIGTIIEETKLIISAEAQSINNVKFTIKPINETEKNKGILLEFTLMPFNKNTFRLTFIEKISDSSLKTNADLIDNGFAKELKLLKTEIDSINPDNYEKILKVNERIDYIYNYFDSQLKLIFQYDNEPNAGTLYYNTDVIIQYFNDYESDKFFKDRAHNYLKIIRILNKKLREKASILNPPIDEVIKKELRDEIQHYFKNNRNEIKEKYIENPDLFIDLFKDFIIRYNTYTNRTRKKFVYDKLLVLRNNETYNNVDILLDKANEIKEKIQIHNFLNSQKSYLVNQKLIDKYKTELKEIDDNYVQRSIYDANIELYKNKVILYKKNLDYKRKIDEKIEEILTSKIIDSLTLSEAQIIYESKDYDSFLLKINTYNNDELKDEELVSKIEVLEFYIVEYDPDLAKPKEIVKPNIKNDKKYSLRKSKLQFNIDSTNNLNIKLKKINPNIENEDYIGAQKEKIKSEKTLPLLSSDLDKNKFEIIIELKRAPLWKFKVDHAELDINDGFIEHIVVLGTIYNLSIENKSKESSFEKKIKSVFEKNEFESLNKKNNPLLGSQLKFVNQFPFGFSSVSDFDDFKNYELNVYKGKHKQFVVDVESLFPNYVHALQNDRLDFSPKDQIVTLPVSKNVKDFVELKKEKSSKLFNLSIYSDFNGLKPSDPNGLLQFEFTKLIPLNTKRQPFKISETILSRSNFGYFNFIKPNFRWARLDANNDETSLSLKYADAFNGENENRIPYVTQLDLLRYENISIGAEINLVSLDFPTAKFRFEINAGGRYARTKVIDTNGEKTSNDDGTNNVRKTFNINTWRYYPDFTFRLRPEERYGATLHFRPIRFNSVTNDFSNISSEQTFTNTLEDRKQWMHQIEINAHFSPSAQKDNRFFFRYRYTNTASWEYNGFSELQVGYSMALKF